MALVVAAIAGLSRIDAYAQGRFDVGLLLGSTRATDEGTVLEFDRGTTYQATFAWHIASAGAVRWSVEVPFLASPAFTIVPPRATLPLEYASLYVTPGIRAGSAGSDSAASCATSTRGHATSRLLPRTRAFTTRTGLLMWPTRL